MSTIDENLFVLSLIIEVLDIRNPLRIQRECAKLDVDVNLVDILTYFQEPIFKSIEMEYSMTSKEIFNDE